MTGRDTLPPGYLAMLSRIESGDRPFVKAATSSASGLYQFIRSTWRSEGGRWGTDMSQAFGGLTPGRAEQDQRATSFTLKNVAALKAAGVEVNRASLYACHFLGAGTAIRLLAAEVKAPVAEVTTAGQRAANPSVLRGTVGDFHAWLHKKTGEWA